MNGATEPTNHMSSYSNREDLPCIKNILFLRCIIFVNPVLVKSTAHFWYGTADAAVSRLVSVFKI